MRRAASTLHLLLVGAMIGATGCSPTQPFYLHEDGDLSHYINHATTAETPDVNAPPLAEVADAHDPLTLSNPDFKGFWELSLEECVSISLANTKYIRGNQAVRLQNGQLFAGTQEGNFLTSNGGNRQISSIYNPSVVETAPGQAVGQLSPFLQSGAGGQGQGQSSDTGIFGARQGVESALAEFDAQLTMTGTQPGSGLFSTTDRPQNVQQGVVTSVFPTVSRLQNGGLNALIAKRTAEGTLFQVSSTTSSVSGNIRGFPTNQPLWGVWTQELQMDIRQPLLAGRGSQINRMPVILARIGTDVEIAGVQGQLQDMLNNIEVRYWDLYLAYRNLETAKVARDSALGTWRIVYQKLKYETEPIQAEAQAREQYFSFRASVEQALRNLYDTENELRFLMGLSPSDGRLIRPKDEPSLARVDFEWGAVLAEAVARRPELIQQRWFIKAREMELILARNQLLPRLDVGAQYRWLGVGDDLIHASRNGIPFKDVATDTGRGSTAWEELTGGKYQEFSFLFQYDMPIGFRRELAAVRHAQLRLTREKALLEDMELDVAHGLAHAIRNLDGNFHLTQTNANRWVASQEDVNAREATYLGGRTSLDDLLEAQRRRAVAQGAFWSSVIEYNKSIADLHTRKGSIMEYDGIAIGEGPWPQKAYWDALARARERDAGLFIDYGWTRPRVISRGPQVQFAPDAKSLPLTNPDGTPLEALPQAEPTPAVPPTGEGTLPAPRTPTPPGALDVRTQPLGNTQLVGATESAAAMPAPASSRRVSGANLAPASFSSANPLRGAADAPVGTGVVDR